MDTNTSLLASASTMEGTGPSLAVEGSTNREVFETSVEWILAPTLSRGQIVVMDNLLRPTKASALGSLSKGSELLFLCHPTHRALIP